MSELSARVMDDFTQVQREMPGLAFHAANVLADEIRRVAPVRTGYMRDHIEVVPTPDGAIVESQAPYSSFPDAKTGFFTETVARMQPQIEKIIFGEANG